MAAYDGPLAKILAHAQNGDIGAQLALGKIYQFGKGVIANLDQALEWFESAAAQDSAEARYHLGVIHSMGQSSSLNYPKALKYYRLAAGQGHAQAQYNLGVMYGAGHGIGKDKIAAYALFKVSRQNGNTKQLDPSASADEMKQIDALVSEMQKPGNLLNALEQRQQQYQKQKMAMAAMKWQNHASTNAIKRKRSGGISPFFKTAFFLSIAIWLLWPPSSKGPLPQQTGSIVNRDAAQQASFDSQCIGPAITDPNAYVQAQEEAAEEGYTINRTLRCIDRPSYESVQAEKVAFAKRQAQQQAEQRQRLADAGQSQLTLARLGFQTAIQIKDANPAPLPNPPAELFIRSDYQGAKKNWLPAFITPDPHDGQRHAAIIWLTGGDSNSLGDFWTPGPDSNDQSVRAFRDAGIVMYFPTLRGGNGDANGKELFLGEVDDVLAAAAQLAKSDYVDPKRIYLGGHSTGGTLALLVAEIQNPFKAVFAFGPVDQIDRYPPSLFPVPISDYGERELKLRSPIHWLTGIRNPAYLIEGMSGSNNSAALDAMCEPPLNPMLHCVRVQHADHFSVLHKVNQRLAAKILIDNVVALSLTDEEFNQ